MVSPAASDRFLSSPWMDEVDITSLQAILNVLVESHEEAGATLLAQGQPNDHIAFLIEGTAIVSRVLESGKTEVLTKLQAPSIFGLTSFFRPHPPGFSVKAETPVWVLTLDHQAYMLLRRADPRASEGLAHVAVRILVDRFDMLDKKISAEMARHPEGHPKTNEWTSFRSRLFDETSI
jgi:CRP/FNR family cyclic AMP-dependent transcriptional regulator